MVGLPQLENLNWALPWFCISLCVFSISYSLLHILDFELSEESENLDHGKRKEMTKFRHDTI